MDNHENLEPKILEFGRKIFSEIGKQQPSIFSTSGSMSRLMQWSMKKPEFKVSLFRLVDVLPQLRTHSAIAKHVSEYISDAAREMGGIIGFGLAGSHDSIRTRIASLFVKRGVREMARMFIAGESAKEAVSKLIALRRRGLVFTLDLLGEYSLSEKEATVYLDRYLEAIKSLEAKLHQFPKEQTVVGHPLDLSPINLSVKLSALYSQCHALNFNRSVEVLSERLSQIVREIKRVGGSVYVDAEDSSTNPMVYQTFKNVFNLEEFQQIANPGIVVQAYNRESLGLLEDLRDYSKSRGGKIAVRLVKGAYWDQENMLCRQMNWQSPLWEHKFESDIHYERLSRFLIDNNNYFIPAFASHNVRSLSHAIAYANSKGLKKTDYELQMLYGMAEPIANAFRKEGFLVRLYVPVGNMIVGMGYLVRRLLENTSNESFLKHTFHDTSETDKLLCSPELFRNKP